ncbi:MAG: collagen-like protein [Solirubrobacteraceae bacterium]
MSSTGISPRITAAAGAVATLALAALVSPPPTSAATIYACVNKRTGAARLFYTKAPRCKRGQARLSWNTQGPAGRNGANGRNGATGKTGPTGKNGTNGINGSNGAVAGYSASEPAFMEFTGKKEVTILAKTVPAGSYIVSAKTVLSSSATLGIRAAGVCELLDGGAVVDTSGWDAGLVQESAKYIGEATLSLQAAVSVKATTVLSLVCSDLSPDEDAQLIGATFSQIAAVQTTQNS